MGHPNQDLLRKGYEAFSKGDMDTIRELFAPDIVFHAPGKSPVAGDYKGIDEVLGFFGKTAELSGGSLKLEVHDALANDEHGVGLVKTSAQREGRSLNANAVHVFHIKDAKVTEVWNHTDDQYGLDEFWS